MKTLLSYLALIALIITSSFTVNQQQQLNKQSENNCFDSFHARRQNKAAVSLSWTVSSSDINQFVVERSYDGEFFEKRVSIDFNGSSDYKFKDNETYRGMIYYRITVVKRDGTTGNSPVESIPYVQRS